jgi:flagellin-like hook-associated protein FlgL
MAGSIMLTSYGKNNNVLVTASEPGTAAGNFVFRYTAPQEGNDELRVNVAEGNGNNPTVVEIMLQTEPGGTVLTTAEQVITLLNTSSLLKNPDGTGRITAAIPTGETGLGTVTPFAEVGYYGSANDSNYLQFLAPAGSPAIKFVSTPGTPLSVDDTTCPPVYANAAAQVQGLEQGTSFTLRSRIQGTEGDDVKVVFRDGPHESAEYDPNSKTVVFTVDFSGRADDPYGADFTMEDLKQLLMDNPEVGDRFSIIPHSSYLFDNPPTFNSELYRGIDAQFGETSGGVVSQGYMVIHLETDENGMIKTTANDLVKFFNDPSTEESAAVLERWGISVACIDPTSTNLTACTIGQASFGIGLLSPTYDPYEPCPPDLKYPDVCFSSYGNNVREGYATATFMSNGGRNADWTLTANNAGAAYNNVSIYVYENVKGPSVQYDPILKMMTVNVNSNNPTTAEEIVALINNDPKLSALFTASLPPHSNGQGHIESGDRAVLTSGILAIDARAEGSIIASGGVHSTFTVRSKQANEQFHNTEVLVVPDLSGQTPKVSYDPQSKQLTLGIDPHNPPTAQQVVDLINSTPGINDYFTASLPAFVKGTQIVPNGNGLVQVGDSGILQAQTTGAAMGAAMIGASDNQSRGIIFHSVEYGSQEFVELYATYGELTVVDRFGIVTERTNGTDIVADINGRAAIGEGRTAKSSTSDLDVEITTHASVQSGDVFGFRISGGGALMQLGPQAIWSQQIRIAIQSVHSTALGGESGTLSQLKTDEQYSLLKDTNTAFRIIQEATVQITAMRGRLGAIQRSQVETNLDHLTDLITIETEARSNIADVEFTAESTEFARQQLLMQSAVTVLQQSGQMKQLLLSLLQK